MSAANNEDIARKFFNAMERKDYDSFLQICTPDAEIWHNTDGAAFSARDGAEALRQLENTVNACAYTIHRAIDFGAGVVVKFTLQVTRLDGISGSTTACGIFDIRDGKVARLEEYYDGQTLQKLFAA